MEKMDVTALGELLIDFTENGVSGQGNPLYEANPGGAPCNVLAMLAKLGHRTAFIGKVGNDFFGKRLKEVIGEAGIRADYLYMDENVHTTLAMVHTFPDGDRDFSFYREPGADMMLTAQEVPEEALGNTGIFHFGTLSMTHEGVREATKKAVEGAKAAGALISFDPNLRPPLWKSMDEAKEQVLYGLSRCDILKISDKEIQWLTGLDAYTEGLEWIMKR
ncbi:MAG: carbohydrate kinase [Lachnospiraceae bacterium]|nr:carbohydrate kinase [Lachnospiraceae bacterium]